MAGETVVISPTGIQVVSAGPQGPPGPATLTPGAVITGEGDLIIGGTGGTPEDLPVGTDGQVLVVDVDRPAWATLGTLSAQDATSVTVDDLTVTDDLIVQGDTALGNADGDLLTITGRMRKAGTTPAVSYGTGAGTGVTGTPTGNDEVIRWNPTTGTTPAANATVATFTFATAKPDTNYIVDLFGMDPDAQASIADPQGIYYDDATRSTTQFLIKVGSSALTASTGYRFGIIVREYA